jgi:hypothetical protein
MTRWVVCAGVILPIAYVATIFWVQPKDHFSWPAGKPPARQRWLYDDYDSTAYALRGLNARMGRRPGRLEEPPRYLPEDFATVLEMPRQAAGERYYLEYPHAALLFFRLGFVLPPWLNPATVPDGLLRAGHTNVVEHIPRNQLQVFLWSRLRQAVQVYEALGGLCLIALVLILWRGYEHGAAIGWPLLLLLLPASMYFSVNRFDMLPALATAASFACLGRRRIGLAGMFLALATMIKLYPILIAVLVARYLMNDPAKLGRWLVFFLVTVMMTSALAVADVGWEGMLAPYRIQLARSTDSYGATFYGLLWPARLAANDWLGKAFRLGTVLATLLAAAARRPANLVEVLARSAIVLVVFVTVQTFYSPQWLLWFAPLVIPLVPRSPALAVILAALDLVTYLTFPVVSDIASQAYREPMLAALVYVRAICLVVMVLLLIRRQAAS